MIRANRTILTLSVTLPPNRIRGDVIVLPHIRSFIGMIASQVSAMVAILALPWFGRILGLRDLRQRLQERFYRVSPTLITFNVLY